MFHKSIFERCGPFDEAPGFSKDYEFWLRRCLIHGCRLRLVPRNTARYRIHGSQPTSEHAGGAEGKDDQIRPAVLSRLPPDLRSRYAEAAAPVGLPPDPLSHRARVAAHRAPLACMPGRAARGAVRAYHRARRGGL